jgi:L-amino acid N-acyltransferase YncA
LDAAVATPWLVRDATRADAAGCRDVYAPYVLGTAVSFETDPPDRAEMAGRIGAALDGHAWVVLEDGGRVAGYAYGGPFMTRPAYRWSVSVSVYTESGRRRPGAGRALYTALFDRLAARGYRTALAGIALPNDASVGLHRAMGFEPVGTYRRVGWKLGRWHDVAWYQRALGADDGPPAPLR